MTATPSRAAWLLAIAALLTLEACGFRLRGTGVDGAPQVGPVYVAVDPEYQELKVALEQTLTANNYQLVGKPERAEIIVRIDSEQTERRVLALSDTGQPTEYQIRYSLFFRITDNQGRVRLGPQDIVLLRDYGFDPSRLLSQSAEEAALRGEMRQEAADIIMQRLSAVPRNNAEAGAP